MSSSTKTIFVDLDGVICSEEATFDRPLAEPIAGARDAINRLRENSLVVIYTARSWSEKRVTEWWLREHGICYDGLVMGKPVADLWIDDRALRFTSWAQIEGFLQHGHDDDHWENLKILREATKEFIEALGTLKLPEPIVEFGPMDPESAIFNTMPDTYIDSRVVFARQKYITADVMPGADHLCDITEAPMLLPRIGPIGTILAFSVLEHVPAIHLVPAALHGALRTGGRAYLITPWNLRFHGPRPDCWRISDDGLRCLFTDLFDISINKIGPPLHPIGLITTLVAR